MLHSKLSWYKFLLEPPRERERDMRDTKYIKGQKVMVLVQGRGQDRRTDLMERKALPGVMVSGGTKNVTIEYRNEYDRVVQESFSLELGSRNDTATRQDHRAIFLTESRYRWLKSCQEIEDNFEVEQERVVTTKTINVKVQGREGIW